MLLSFACNVIDKAVNRPQNKEELFNLRHSSARNVVERIFGVVKKRWTILMRPPEYSMTIQVRIFPALAAIHNFIRIHDTEDIHDFDDEICDPHPSARTGQLATSLVSPAERERAADRRDEIAQQMWDDYLEYLERMDT